MGVGVVDPTGPPLVGRSDLRARLAACLRPLPRRWRWPALGLGRGRHRQVPAARRARPPRSHGTGSGRSVPWAGPTPTTRPSGWTPLSGHWPTAGRRRRACCAGGDDAPGRCCGSCRSWQRRTTPPTASEGRNGSRCSTRWPPCWRRRRSPARWCCCSTTCTGPTRGRCGCCTTWSRRRCRRRCWWPAAGATTRRTPRPTGCARLVRRAEPMPLRGLEAPDVAELVALTAGLWIDPEEAAALTSRTGGNPLFVTQVGRLAKVSGTSSMARLVPDSAQDLLRHRLGRGSPSRPTTCSGGGGRRCRDRPVVARRGL